LQKAAKEAPGSAADDANVRKLAPDNFNAGNPVQKLHSGFLFRPSRFKTWWAKKLFSFVFPFCYFGCQ